MTSRLSSIRVRLDVGGLQDLRAEGAQPGQQRVALAERRAAAGGQPAVVGAGGLADQRVADPPIRCRTSQRQLPSGIPGRRGASRAWSRACSAAGRPGGTVGHRGLLAAGETSSVTQVTGATTPRLGGETVPLFNHLRDRDRAHRLPARAGRRGPASSGWPWWRWRCCSSSVRRWSRWPGCPPDLLVAGRAPRRGRLPGAAAGGCASRAWVLRCTDDGYRVRLVRGAGVDRGALERGRGRGRRRTATTWPASSCGCGTAGPRRSRSACWPWTRSSSCASCRSGCSAATGCGRSEAAASRIRFVRSRAASL